VIVNESIPRNLLSEGNLLVNVALMSLTATTALRAQAGNAVTFRAVDNLAKDSARPDYVGPIGGFLRSFLERTTEFRNAEDMKNRSAGEFVNQP